MPNQTLYFNILTFDYPKGEQVFYFSEHMIGRSTRIYKTQFPYIIEDIIPGITTDHTDFIYTTFNEEKEGFMPLPLEFSTENKDLLHQHYNRQINKFFKSKSLLVRTGFIGENQVWVLAPELTTSGFDVYHKYSLRIQFANVSLYPELILSYNGKSKVIKQSVQDLAKKVPSNKYVWFRVGNELLSIAQIKKRRHKPEYAETFLVLNNPVAQHLNIPPDEWSRDDKYKVYRDQIKSFYTEYLNQHDFKAIIPLNDTG